MPSAMQKPLKIALAGFGTVGGGLVQLLAENAELVQRRCGRTIQIKSILVRDLNKPRSWPLPEGAVLTDKPEELLQDPEIDVVVELIGGLDSAKRIILQALEAGRHVVTANKALLAEDGAEIFALAARKGLHLAYEASVCGGIPIIQTLREGLAANNVHSLSGILNGTSNYILSAMTTEGLSFEKALKQAQELGFAEADPTLDIEGFDAAHKLALLIRLAWGVDYPFHKLPVRGISSVAPEDIQFAREFGYNIKLLGQARMVRDENGQARLEAGVFPTLVPKNFLLAKVGHSYNAVRIEGNAVGPVFLHGRGAGALPTASAVAADLLRIARGQQVDNSGFVNNDLPLAEILPPEQSTSCYYCRMMVPDRPGVLRDVAAALADHDISIAQALQKGQTDIVPLMFMTHDARADNVAAALKRIQAQGFLCAEPSFYRVLPQSGHE